jgi:polyhydroxybutyrate depolymerase
MRTSPAERILEVHVRPLHIAVLMFVASCFPTSAWAWQGGPGAPPCSVAAVAGVEQQLISGGRPRVFRLFVPPGFSEQTRMPLVLDLHPSGRTAAGQAKTSGFETLAAREGFVVASLQAEGGRWNVPVADGRADDVLYVSDVIDQIARTVCVDRSRIYAAGFSGGGRMASLLACRLNARIAAIAPMSSLRWPAPCDGRPVPILALHGLADPQNPYAGHAEGRGAEWVESVEEALAGWARHDKCDPTVIREDPPGPLSVMRYAGCASGAEVRLIRIDGLGHTWARQEVDATAVMWEFFSHYTLVR